ncbi:hypothetical protein P152DRAFT_417190, partial [Eremomyces bilateralis CBS 781.70]
MYISGFTGTPVTKLLIGSIIASAVAVSIFDVKYLVPLQVIPHIWEYGQIWRFLTWQGAYLNSTEVLFAVISIYQIRVVERLWGSRKFASFLLLTLPYTTLLPPLLLLLILRPFSFNTLNLLPAGPTAILFALLSQYHSAIPHTYKYNLSTSLSPSPPHPEPEPKLTSKSITYLTSLQLLAPNFPSSLLPALIGWSVGNLWRADALPGVNTASRIPWWLLPASSRPPSAMAPSDRIPAASTSRGSWTSWIWSVLPGTRAAERREYEGLRRRMEAEASATGEGSG